MVKTISIDRFQVKILIDNPAELTGDLVLKCQLGKPFDEFRKTMKNENIDGLFKKSCFAHFLELSKPRLLCFPMIMIYGLLKHRIMYAGDDEGSNERVNKMDEVRINYCGMPICFGLKEFVIMMGLRCDRPEDPAIKKTPHTGSNKCKVKKDGLLGIVGPSYKVKELIVDLKNKDIPKHYREKLCLVWFVHSVLWARDVRKVIEHDLLALADDFGKFNDYPWGYDSYYLTVKYLLKEIKPKTTILYGFSWAFMVKLITIFTHSLIYIEYTCDFFFACFLFTIFRLGHVKPFPPLRKYFTNYPNKVSHPRILRWLAAVESSKKSINKADLFNPSNNAVCLLSTKIIFTKERY